MAHLRGAGWARPLASGGSGLGWRVAPPRFDGLAASVGVETGVSNELLSVRACAPVTRCFMRLSTTAGRPEEATPSTRRLA